MVLASLTFKTAWFFPIQSSINIILFKRENIFSIAQVKIFNQLNYFWETGFPVQWLCNYMNGEQDTHAHALNIFEKIDILSKITF